MVKITYVSHDGTAQTVEVASGLSVMEGAVHNNIPGIDADCGGSCACGTCQVYVGEEWISRVGDKTEMEDQMLELASGVRNNSRLSCQIRVTPEMDGLSVELPKSQH
jgi:2Fe-2S ferredoxin